MPFPANPTNGQTATLRGITYTYNSTKKSWSVSTLYSNTGAFTTINGNLNAPGATFSGTDAIKVPVGNTSQRPTAATGQLRFNSDINVFEGYNGTIWGSIGGGAKIQDTAPSNPIAGDLWWKSNDGQLYIYYNDGDSNQWVIASSFAGSGGYLPITGGNVTGNLGVSGTINVTGNANVGNIGTATAIATTANLTTINSGLLQNGNSNVAITANGNVTISSNGSVRMTVDTIGRVTLTNQPCFHAYSSSNIATSNSWTGWTALVNVGSHFNATTGVFTAPVAGTYMFSFGGLANGTNSLEVFAYKNGAAINAGTAIRVANGGSSGGDSCTFYITLAATDTISLYINQGPTNTNGNFNFFNGRLIQ